MLVYLTARTWVGERGAPNGAFAQELRRAMERGTRLVLAHEMPGRGQEGRAAVEFGAFLSDGRTPTDLIAKGVYALVAVPLLVQTTREWTAHGKEQRAQSFGVLVEALRTCAAIKRVTSTA